MMLRDYYLKAKNYIATHKIIGLAVVCLAGLCLFLSMKRLLSVKQEARLPLKPLVHTQTVSRRPMYGEIALFGQIQAKARIDIVNKYAGVVDNVSVDLGQRVKAGDTLLVQRLDDAEAEMLKTQARYREAGANAATYDTEYNADLARYEADYKLAQINAGRYERLYKLGAVSQYERDAMQQNLVNKKALYEELALQRSYDGTPSRVYRQQQIAERRYQEYIIAQNKYRDMIFCAPRDGVIIYRHAEEGGYLPAGTKLLTLLDDSGYTVDCDVPEADIAAIAEGEPVELLIEALGEPCRGSIAYVSQARSAENNKFFVRVRLEETPAAIKAGLFAKGSLKLLQKPNAIYIDKTALTDRNGKYFAYVLADGNKVEQRVVALGVSNSQSVEIIKGLQEGDRLIVDNIARLRSGLIVEAAEGAE